MAASTPTRWAPTAIALEAYGGRMTIVRNEESTSVSAVVPHGAIASQNAAAYAGETPAEEPPAVDADPDERSSEMRSRTPPELPRIVRSTDARNFLPEFRAHPIRFRRHVRFLEYN